MLKNVRSALLSYYKANSNHEHTQKKDPKKYQHKSSISITFSTSLQKSNSIFVSVCKSLFTDCPSFCCIPDIVSVMMANIVHILKYDDKIDIFMKLWPQICFVPPIKSSRGHNISAGALVTLKRVKPLFTSVWFIFE